MSNGESCAAPSLIYPKVSSKVSLHSLEGSDYPVVAFVAIACRVRSRVKGLLIEFAGKTQRARVRRVRCRVEV
jgi:hypothetical protein